MKANWLFWGVFGYYCLLLFISTDGIITSVRADEGLPLNDFITHFEPVYYDHIVLHRKQQRSKRSPTAALKVQLFAPKRIFNMKLKKDNIFAEDIVFESSDGPFRYDISRVFLGTLEDDTGSVVRGILTGDGHFDGTVTTSSGTEFNIEPATRYFETPTQFQSLVYSTSDIRWPNENATCHSELLRRRRQRNCHHHNNHHQYQQQHVKHKHKKPHNSSSSSSSQFNNVYYSKKYFNKFNKNNIIGANNNIGSSSNSSSSSSSSSRSSRRRRRRRRRKGENLENVFENHLSVMSSRNSNSAFGQKKRKTMNRSNLMDSRGSSRSSGSSGQAVITSKMLKHLKKSMQDINSAHREKMTISTVFNLTHFDPFHHHHHHHHHHHSHHHPQPQPRHLHHLKKEEKVLNLKMMSSSSEENVEEMYMDEIGNVLDEDDDDDDDDAAEIEEEELEDVASSSTSSSSSSSSFSSGYIHKKKKARSKHRSMPYDYELLYAANNPSSSRLQVADTFQQKRAVIDPKKTTCMLYLQADHLFYMKMGSIEACIETMTRHVQKVNSIYRVTDFDQDGRLDNISFMIKRIKVHTEEALKDPNYRFPGNYGVEKFLELFSEEDYDAFCLAYMFTYRDFEGGTLGLAWTGDLKNAGGVCEKNGHYRGSLKSLNTGIVTLLNYGKHVPPAVSHVTLAHEIGHNFGSPHDPEDNRACTPGGEDGNYIMFARATSGDKRNNNKFSPCSLRSINSVLNTKARGNKGCFTEPQDSICGNEVVEKGEECDCGWEEDCEEACCFPMRANPPKDEPPCKLRPNKTCSPSQGPCCSSECKLQIGTKCRDDNGCRDSSSCDGFGPRCPPSTNKPNKTVCNEGFVCYMGECTGSICIAYGLESCQCRREKGDPVTKACELCCKLPGEDQPCRSSFSWNSTPYEVPGMFAKPGTPCDNYNGYCDMFQKCREVDPSGPLATLRKLLLSTESIASLKKWIVDNWWAVMFFSVGFLVILIVIVKVFGKSPDLKMKVVNVTGQFPGSNNLAFPSVPQLAITTTTTVGRTNYPVATTVPSHMANGYHFAGMPNGCHFGGIPNGRHFGNTPNGWV